MASIFTKLITGEFPCYKLYETENIFSFLAKDSIRLGHALIIPKIEWEHFSEMSPEVTTELFSFSQKLSKAIYQSTDCVKVGACFQGFEVLHCHMHLIPMWSPADLNFKSAKEFSVDDMKLIQSKIIKALG